MNWKNIKLIFMREVRDQLRDRRTLFMIAVLPILLYPAMGIGMFQMTALFTEQPRTVVILGADELPPPQLVEDGRFVSSWFVLPQDADKLEVITDSEQAVDNQPGGVDDDAERLDDRHQSFIVQAQMLRAVLAQRAELDEESAAAEQGGAADTAKLQKRLAAIEDELSEQFSSSEIQVLILVPEGFKDNVAKVNRDIAQREGGSSNIPDYPRPIIVRNSADEKSMIAYRRVKEALESWERKILEARLAQAGLPDTLPEPVNPEPLDLARESQLSASIWAKLFPALLIVMAATGAFYPAVDLAAGEKERGTMETLLICPASRSEIVTGKFLTIMLFSMATAVLNLMSMGLTGKYVASLGGGGNVNFAALSYPSASAIVWLLILLVPMAALFSALCLALATFARSSKEGQYYLTPLLMVTMGLTVFCLSPAVEITPFYSIMPVVGVALLLKGFLLSPADTAALYLYAVPVLVTSVGYSLLALWWAIEQFNREDVLFREAERFELGLWVRHLLRDKESTPNFAEAGICFVIIMLLQFVTLKFMQAALVETTDLAPGTLMLRLLLIQQLVIIASPALFMSVMLTTNVLKTLRLCFPSWRMLAAAAVLPLALHPLSLELSANLGWFFPPLPKHITDALAIMSSDQQPLWFVLLGFAVAPAICEELAFRGFILTGFSRGGRVGLAVVLSSLTFGIMHMIPQQVFNATLVGLVLGLLAVRSGSLWPCILFHFTYNSLEVIRGRYGAAIVDGAGWFVSATDQGIRYRWPTLILAAIAATLLLRWLIFRSEETSARDKTPLYPDQPSLSTSKVGNRPPVGIS